MSSGWRCWGHGVKERKEESVEGGGSKAAVAGQGSVGWEGVEGRRRRRGEGGGGAGGKGRWLSFEEAINCKAQGTVKEKKRVHVGTWAFLRNSELFATVSRDSEHM
ncbi:hypothetical protein PAMP_018439 [Pampus punctatissimus]